jgi:hypothetical protein
MIPAKWSLTNEAAGSTQLPPRKIPDGSRSSYDFGAAFGVASVGVGRSAAIPVW